VSSQIVEAAWRQKSGRDLDSRAWIGHIHSPATVFRILFLNAWRTGAIQPGSQTYKVQLLCQKLPIFCGLAHHDFLTWWVAD
jgi:hypothetical protein